MQKRSAVRWAIIAMIAVATVINYIDRNALAVMWPQISKDVGATKEDYALLVTVFMLFYATSVAYAAPRIGLGNAIFFVLRTGCQWEALDATGICPHSTAHDRFQEWEEAGVWTELWRVLLEEYDELEGLDWSYLSVDGSMTKAPLATVGEKRRAQPDGSRQARGQAQRGHGGSRHTSRGDGGRSQS